MTRSLPLAEETGRRVRAAADVDEAMRAMAHVLRRRFGIWRCSLRWLDEPRRTLTFAAVWCAGTTRLQPGMTMSALTTSLADVLSSGGDVLFWGDTEPTALDSVLEAEGIKSWVCLPLVKGNRVQGLLNLSSRSRVAIGSHQKEFFRALREAVNDPLVELAARSLRRVPEESEARAEDERARKGRDDT